MTSSAQRIPVLMYHRIGTAHNEWERKYCVSPETFAAHMDTLARSGWKAISIDNFFAWLDGGAKLPEGAFLLTFDDGFLGVHDHAAPVLRRLGWPATVFLVSALIGQRDTWCATHNPDGHTYPLMDRSQILALREQGFSFHSHTRNHADLPTLDDDALVDQLAGARKDLAALLERRLGSAEGDTAAALKREYRWGGTTCSGYLPTEDQIRYLFEAMRSGRALQIVPSYKAGVAGARCLVAVKVRLRPTPL